MALNPFNNPRRLTELCAGLDAVLPETTPDSDPLIGALECDSRRVVPGSLFAALPGAKADGSAFIPQAVARGAVAVLARPGTTASIPVATSLEPRLTLARLAAIFYGRQPETVVAVTGTNGKTSVASFTRQIWARLGHRAASLGTLGLIADGFASEASLTTPDPIRLHETLARLANAGIGHVALEASSHGLDQFRLDGVVLKAAAFTNLTRDHLDYHGTMAAYFRAKAGLFDRVLPAGGVAVLNAESSEAGILSAIAASRGQTVLSYGEHGRDIAVTARRTEGTVQILSLTIGGRDHVVRLPLLGAFQASNALCALGLAIATGADPLAALEALETLTGAPGRLEHVTDTASGAPILVDYAHTPDALETVLRALRPHCTGKLVVVFGCGGDRDPGKRPMMGGIAARLADRVYVTDDNPRNEDAGLIRRAVIEGAVGPAELIEIADRGAAIVTAASALDTGDLLVIAGKGHEPGQIIGSTVIPFDDRTVALAATGGGRMTATAQNSPLWQGREVVNATGALGAADWAATGISIDSRTLQPGDLFIALVGEHADGHAHLAQAFRAGAIAALVEHIPADIPATATLLRVDDTRRALEDLARAARSRITGKVVAVTGSVGKTSTKDALALVFSRQGETAATKGNLNNHYGVPLSLARMPRAARFAVFELGMNHPGEISPLSRMVRPDVAIITTVASAHLEFFADESGIADEKATIMDGLPKTGTVILNRDNLHFERLVRHAATRGITTVVSFGSDPTARVRLIAFSPSETSSAVVASIDGRIVPYQLGSPGRHAAMNSLAVLAAVHAIGGNVDAAALALADATPPKGRGQPQTLTLRGDRVIRLIDDSYNASPAAVRAALSVLGGLTPGGTGRRIAALGDMLELGPTSPALHAGLATAIDESDIDLLFTAGTLMRHLFDAVHEDARGAHAPSAAELAPILIDGLRDGDVLTVKGSFGSRMSDLVTAIQAAALDPSRGKAE